MSGPRLQGLIDSIVAEVQELESASTAMLLQRYLETATGDQMDIIGEIVGMARADRSDSEYRSALRFQVAMNTSGGEPETMIDAAAFYTDSTSVHFVEKHPAEFALWVETDQSSVPDSWGPSMERVRPGGVRQNLSYNIDQTATWFAFAVETGYWDSTQLGGGFGEYNYDATSGSGGLAEQVTIEGDT